MLEVSGASPSELRERFLEALRQAVQRAWADDRIDLAVTEELIRALNSKARS
jgi:hypothetical protein